MHFAQRVPGHICGLHFSSDPRCFDGTNRFIDYSEYGNDATFYQGSVSTPAFSKHGTYSREGILLDNSFQLKLVDPIPWDGAIIVVGKVHLPTTSKRLTTLLFGDDFSFPFNNGSISFYNANPSITFTIAPPTAGVSSGITVPADTIFVAGFACDEQNRQVYSTLDAVTVNASSAVAGTDSHTLAMGAHGNVGLAGTVDSRMIIIGNNACNTGATTTADPTDKFWLFHLDCFKRNPLVNDLPKLADYYANLKAYYGA